jgi:hypothetical protein
MTVNPENKPEVKTEQAQTNVQPVEQNKAAPVAISEAAPEIKSEANQTNWRAFREKQAAERKSREDAEKRAAEAEAQAQAFKLALEASVNKPSNNRQTNEYGSSDLSEETEDQRIDRRVEQAIKQREVAAEKKRIEREAQELPKKITEVYSDFNSVCTHENMDYLKFHYPEVAKAYEYLPDNLETWSTVYKAIKRFVPNQADSKHDAQKAEKNLAKPGSISSTGNTHSGNAMGAGGSARLTEARMAENYARMQRTIKSLKD